MNRQQSVVSQHRFLILICVILIAGLGFTSVNLSSVDSISQQDLQSVEVHRNISFGKSPTTAKSAMTFEEYNYVAKTPIDRHTLPYKCGILFFYHIACTGGASINKWLIRNKEQNNVTYFTHWGRQPSVEQAFITKMNEHSESLMPNEWKVAHAHGYSFLTNTSEQYLYTWRKIVEGKGCKLIIATVLKDAVGHSISQSKGRFGQNGRYGNMTIDEYLAPLEPQNGNQRWNFLTQLDYLVYNHGPRNTYLVPKEEKVKRAMELLRRHFDIVIYQNHKKFQEIVVNITGWKMDDIPHANVYHGQLNYTQRELDKFRRLTYANGDVEFIKAVRLYYGGYLEYLVE